MTMTKSYSGMENYVSNLENTFKCSVDESILEDIKFKANSNMNIFQNELVKIARLAHQLNKEYCSVILDDNSQPDWSDAPEWQKESAINGVKMFLTNPDATPEDSHKNWYDFKKKDGWKFGPVKDPIKKEHPCMMPYEELPDDQKVKDSLYSNTVKILLERLVTK